MKKAIPHPKDPEGYVAVIVPLEMTRTRSICSLCALSKRLHRELCVKAPCYSYLRPDARVEDTHIVYKKKRVYKPRCSRCRSTNIICTVRDGEEVLRTCKCGNVWQPRTRKADK